MAFGNSFNENERCLLAGYDNGDVKLFDLRTNTCAFLSLTDESIYISLKHSSASPSCTYTSDIIDPIRMHWQYCFLCSHTFQQLLDHILPLTRQLVWLCNAGRLTSAYRGHTKDAADEGCKV